MASKKRKLAIHKKQKRKKLSPVDALIQLTDRRLEPKHYNKLFGEILRTRNSRGAGILIGTYVENSLQSALERWLHISDKKRRALFGSNAPIGTFSNKIRIAYAAGIIGNEMYDTLDKIRLIRNAFAHARISVSFKTKEIIDVCALLKIPIPLFPFHNPALYAKTTRGHFTETCFVVSHNLLFAALTNPHIIDTKYITIPVDQNFEVILRRKPLP